MLNEAYTFYRPGKDITCHADAALTGKRLCRITGNRTGGGIVAPLSNTDLQSVYTVGAPLAGGTIFGVVGYDVASGAVVPVKRGGIIAVTASGAIAAEGLVEVLANGKIVALTTGKPVGMVLTAVADGADAEFLMFPNGGVGSFTQQARVGQLVDNSGGVAVDGTIAAVTTSATAADAIKELATKVNAIELALHNAGITL